MAFNNIAVCILINSSFSLFSFSATKLTFLRNKSKQSMDTYTQELNSSKGDSPLNSVLHKSDCN